MLHLIFCLRRLPHLSREEFQRYWREQHAPLVRAHAAALGIHRYVRAHTVDHPVAEAAAAPSGECRGDFAGEQFKRLGLVQIAKECRE